MALLLVLGAAVLALRYAPLIDDVRAVRDSAQRLASQVRALGPADLDALRLTGLRGELTELEREIAPIRDMLSHDALVGLARALPLVGSQVQAADSLVQAAESLTEAGDLGLGLADELVTLRETDAGDPATPMLPRLVGLMATSGDRVDRIAELIGVAGAHLDAIPPDALGPILEARDLVREPLREYAPLLEAYREADDVVPGMLGWGGARRYLILAQNPAELRPAGGYAGTIGVLGFRDGALVEQQFQDVYDIMRKPGLPWIEPPEELVAHLLGEGQSWRSADAAWAADFPTAARKALEMYAIEAGDADLDGVIAMTTYALDRMLEVVGPVTVEEYDITVEPGDVTLTLLGATRGTPADVQGRKDVLDVLARTVMARLLALPPERWAPMVEAIGQIGSERMAMVWLADEEAQDLILEAGWSGVVRQERGDYLYVVESNMAPTSKYNLVVDRTDSLVVRLDEEGDALNSLRLDWQNDAGKPGEPYRSIREFSVNKEGWYGSYVRVLAPSQSELVTASGRASDEIRGAERVHEEAGRASFGTYLLMPPGPSTMTWLWSAPGVALPVGDTWEYRIVVQKQPGARPRPFAIRIDLPDGAALLEAPADAVVRSGRVQVERSLATDQELRLLYELPPSQG